MEVTEQTAIAKFAGERLLLAQGSEADQQDAAVEHRGQQHR